MSAILSAPTRWVLFLTSEDIDRDFSRYHAYLDDLPVLYLEGQDRQSTVTLQLRPAKTDIGQSQFEARPEFGDWFAQGDFSHGMGQRFFHRSSRDDAKYLLSEGFDISEPGVLRHVNTIAVVNAVTFTAPRALAEFNDLPFVSQNSDVYSGNALFPGSWNLEDPNAGEGDAEIYDLASTGEYLYAAFGTNGVHRRNTAGTWDHFQPDASTDLDTGDTRIVRWLKDRLMVVGAGGTAIYEVVADSTPDAIETLPAGWTFEDVWESGQFIFATAVNPEAGMCRVHAYGLNSGLTAIEKKSSTPMPKGLLIYSGVGTQGRIFMGGGQMTDSGGLASILMEGSANETGEIQFLLIQRETDDDANDYSVRAIEVTPDSILFGWGRSSSSPFGAFVGVGQFNLARNAFSLGLKIPSPVADEGPARDLITFRSRVLFTTADDVGGELTFYYEDLDNPVDEAILVTSVADWNTTTKKTWDLFEITHHALPVEATIDLQYSKKNPDEVDWQDAMTSEIPGSVGLSARFEDVVSRLLVLKLTSNAPTTSSAPEVLAFSVRSMPTPDDTEWRLTRTVRVLDRDRKNRHGEPVKQDPWTVRSQIQDMAHRFVTVYEPGVTWIAYVEDVAQVEPGMSIVSEADGTSEKEAYFIELRMVARRAA